MGKVYTRFQTKTAQKAYPNGTARNYITYVREYPPPPPTHTPQGTQAHNELLLCYSVIAQRRWVALVISVSADIYFRLIELQSSVKL